jgi:hypothetical protein
MRKQYHFQPSEKGLLAWDIYKLIEHSAKLKMVEIPLAEIKELDEPYWFQHDGASPTCRHIMEHAKLIHAADLQFPIILSSSGRVMDGMHRICRALLENKPTVLAVQFAIDPPPDYIGVHPDLLPY